MRLEPAEWLQKNGQLSSENAVNAVNGDVEIDEQRAAGILNGLT